MKTVSAKITVALLAMVMILAVMPLSVFSLSQQQQEDIYRVDTLWQEEYPAKYIDFLLSSDNFVYHLDVTEGNIIQDITYESIELNAYQKKENYKEILIAIIEHTHSETNNLSKQETAKEVQQEFMSSLEKHILGFVTEGYDTLEKICTALQNTSSQLLNQVYLPDADVTQLYYTEIYQMIYSQIDDPAVRNQAREMLESYTGSQAWLKNTKKFSICLDMMNMGMNICQDYLDGIIELEALAKTNEKYVELLQYIHGHTSDMALKAACFELSDKLSSSYEDNLKTILYEAVADNAMESIGFAILKEAFSDANVYTKSIVYAIDAGMAVSKWLFNVSDIYSHMQTVYCVNVISELLVQQVRRDLADLHIYDQPTTKAAGRAADTIYHIKTLIGLRKIGEANYYALKNSVYSARLTRAVGALFWDLANKNMATVDEWYTELGKAMSIVEASLFQIIPAEYYYVPEELPEFTVENGVLTHYNGNMKEVYVTYDITSIAPFAFQNAIHMESVEIFDTVKKISSNSFYGCSSLKAVIIHRPDATIEANAFVGCGEDMVIHGYEGSTAEVYAWENGFSFVPFNTDYETTPDEINPDFIIENGVLVEYIGNDQHIYVPYGVTEIADEVFCARGIYSVVLPNTVEKIGYGAFMGCSLLSDLYIPDSVKEIGDYAFGSCSKLDESNVRLPDTLTRIGYRAFSGTKAYRAFAASDEICFYFGKYLMLVENAYDVTEITVKEGTKVIADNAFAGLSALTSVNLPDTLEHIGYQAFANTSISSVSLPRRLKSIGEYAFRSCANLTEIVLPNSLTEVPMGAFYECGNLKNVNLGTGVTTICEYAFAGCPVTVLSASDSLTSFQSAFEMEIERFTLLEGSTSIPSLLFDMISRYGLKELRLPTTLKSIPSMTFADCISLETVVLPNSIERIGSKAFYSCENLKSLTLPEGLLSIGDAAFCNCTALTSVTIPKTVTYIGAEAFLCCEGLETLTISDGVPHIGSQAFSQCGIKELYLPTSITVLEEYAFSHCPALETVEVNIGADVLTRGVFAGCEALKNVTLCATLKEVMPFAFSTDWNITNVYYAGSCVEWAEIDFHYDSAELTGAPNLTFAAHVGEWEPLTPPACTAPGTEQLLCTFCGHLSTRETAEWHLWDSEWTVDLPASCTENGSRSRHCVNCDEKTEVTPIPAAHTFSAQFTVDLPSTCTTEGSQSRHCQYCDEKTDVTPIPAAHRFSAEWTVDLSPTETAEGQKSRHCLLCDEKTDITPIPKLLTPAPAEDFDYFERDGKIEIYGYRGTATELLIPSTVEGKPVTKISGFTFSDNATLKVLVIPDSVVELESYALYKCTALEKVTLGKGVTVVADSLFSDCYQLREVIFEGEITSVGEWAFFKCSSLESLTLTHALTEIKSYAFWESSAFTTLYFHGSEEEWQRVNVSSTGNRILLNATVHFIAHTHAYVEIAPLDGERHQLLCSCGDYIAEAHLWLFFGCEIPRRCSICGESETTTFGHTFLTYLPNGDATYTEDGTKTAKCEYCNVTDTQPDLGSALGLPQQFKDEMSQLSQNNPASAEYADLYSLLMLYSTLSPEEREAVTEEYRALQQAVILYNEKADEINQAAQSANQQAFITPLRTAATLLAGLWLWLLKKIIL